MAAAPTKITVTLDRAAKREIAQIIREMAAISRAIQKRLRPAEKLRKLVQIYLDEGGSRNAARLRKFLATCEPFATPNAV